MPQRAVIFENMFVDGCSSFLLIIICQLSLGESFVLAFGLKQMNKQTNKLLPSLLGTCAVTVSDCWPLASSLVVLVRTALEGSIA
jgi:hypothetical protein